MDECQLNGLCYNFDDKYFPRHKCKEQNLLMAMSEDVSEEEADVSHVLELPHHMILIIPLIHWKLNH